MKTNIASRLSVRVKFKSFDTVELCIIDSETGEIQLEHIPVLLGKSFPEDKSTEEVSSVIVEEDPADDTDSDEDGGIERK